MLKFWKMTTIYASGIEDLRGPKFFLFTELVRNDNFAPAMTFSKLFGLLIVSLFDLQLDPLSDERVWAIFRIQSRLSRVNKNIKFIQKNCLSTSEGRHS